MAIAIVGLVAGVVFMTLGVRYPRFQQPLFRDGWLADVFHALANSLLLDVPLALSLAAVSRWIEFDLGISHVRLLNGQPLLVQVVVFLIGGDLVKWTIHMLHHRIPFLWRFHRLHHCTQQMDALSSARSHPVEAYINRLVFLTAMVVVAGIDLRIVILYSAVDLVQGLWIHSNTHMRTGWLNYVLSTQEFHHWHHANEVAAFNKNYGGFLSIWDWIFGTAYCPADRQVPGFGIPEMPRPPTGYLDHLRMPFILDTERRSAEREGTSQRTGDR
jgi:sterol desaturase/sphingolipid hydroxylase (fatty acid hydroxylase superfamily)